MCIKDNRLARALEGRTQESRPLIVEGEFNRSACFCITGSGDDILNMKGNGTCSSVRVEGVK